MPTVRLLTFILMPILAIASSATAQDSTSGPNTFQPNASEGSDIDSRAIAPSAVLPVVLPPKPFASCPKVRVIDKKFVGVMTALAGSETLRYTTHTLVLDHEYAAGAPWVTHAPGNPRLIGKYGAFFAAELLVAYEWKKPHSWLPGDRFIQKLWGVPPAVMTTIHIKNGVRSIHTQAPLGCPPQYCGAQ